MKLKLKLWQIILIIFAIVEIPGLIMLPVTRHRRASRTMATPMMNKIADSTMRGKGISLASKTPSSHTPIENELELFSLSQEDPTAMLEKSHSVQTDKRFIDWMSEESNFDFDINVSTDGIPTEFGTYVDLGFGWMDLEYETSMDTLYLEDLQKQQEKSDQQRIYFAREYSGEADFSTLALG